MSTESVAPEPAISPEPVPTSEPPSAPEREITPLREPRDGTPPVLSYPSDLPGAVRQLAAGTGPVAIDAERASGYRYGQRAYLVQLRRAGSGTVLIDPIAITDLSSLQEVLRDVEWVLHAASQDLPCLREIGLSPTSLFDTELAGRLLGFPRVGLAALVEQVLGMSLAKEHSAADWSTRPLPQPWLTYAALDVEVLVELREELEAELVAQGKLGWALEEFSAVIDAPPAPPRVDPWRRTSGIHKLRKPRQLAVVRQMWLVRDQIARTRDTAPGRILQDSAIAAAATALVPSASNAESAAVPALADLPAFAGRGARRHLRQWDAAVASALAMPDSALPAQVAPLDGPPPPRAWAERDPIAAARLAAVRAAVAVVAEQIKMPPENVLPPDTVKRLAWEPPPQCDIATIGSELARLGARPWQVGLTAGPVSSALTTPVSPEPSVLTNPPC